MRYIAAQYLALLTDGLFLRNAAHANAMAARLARGLEGLPGVRVTEKVEANEVFAVLPPAADALRAQYGFYAWDEARGIARLVTSWDTPPEDVDGFLDACRARLVDRL
jgi:threonine aldolase